MVGIDANAEPHAQHAFLARGDRSEYSPRSHGDQIPGNHDAEANFIGQIMGALINSNSGRLACTDAEMVRAGRSLRQVFRSIFTTN